MANAVLEIGISASVTYKTRNRGLASNGTSYASHVSPDSLIVNYSNSVNRLHYQKYIINNNTKALKFDNSRSLLNEKNYAFMVLKSTKKRQELEYQYIFTTQDYKDAVQQSMMII